MTLTDTRQCHNGFKGGEPMKRTMELFDVLADLLDQKTLDQLEITCEELIEPEWDLEVMSYSKGTAAVMYLSNGDPGYPAEPTEYEVDATPTAVAQRLTQLLTPFLPVHMVDPEIIRRIWYAIYDAESKWQDNNLDAEVHNMMQGE